MEKELVRIALVGTQRGQLSEKTREVLNALGIKNNVSEEEILLSAAAIFSKIKKANFSTIQLSPPLKPIINSNNNVCGPRSIKHLYMIVDGAFEHALPEFLYNLAKNKKCLPPEILPDLLEQSLTSPELWRKLKKNIGERGEWIIRQNPHWHRLLSPPIPDNWEDSSNDERLSILRKLRKEDPTKALDLAKEAWKEESVNQRIRFLKVLETNLDQELEIFLETLLDDRRKEVRRTAVQILAKIPNSALSYRIFNRLKELINIKKRTLKKDKLTIELPNKLDDNMIRDGIDPRVQWFKGGVKASRLGQMIALTPPHLWLEYLEMDATEALELFVRSDWGELLVQAMAEATYLHKNEAWTEAILSFKIESQHIQRWQSLNVSRLMENVTDDVFNNVAIKGMKKAKGLLEENSPITMLLKTGSSLWTDELTQLVMKNLQEWLAGETSRYWNGWHYRTILKKAGYTCNPFLHDKLTADWPEESKIWSSWEKEIEEFLSTLYFRKKMIDGLSSHSS
jgi:hypothetical protein